MSAQQRVALWAAEPDLDDDINDVDIPLAIPSYPTTDIYDDPNLQLDDSALLAVQAQIAQQTAFAQIPDVVKRASSSTSCITSSLIFCSSVHRPFPSSRLGQQPPRNHPRLRIRLEPPHRKILRQNGMA